MYIIPFGDEFGFDLDVRILDCRPGTRTPLKTWEKTKANNEFALAA